MLSKWQTHLAKQKFNCIELYKQISYLISYLVVDSNFLGKNTGVGGHFLLQGIFLTQESNWSILPWHVEFLPLNHQGSPMEIHRTVKWR